MRPPCSRDMQLAMPTAVSHLTCSAPFSATPSIMFQGVLHSSLSCAQQNVLCMVSLTRRP